MDGARKPLEIIGHLGKQHKAVETTGNHRKPVETIGTLGHRWSRQKPQAKPVDLVTTGIWKAPVFGNRVSLEIGWDLEII